MTTVETQAALDCAVDLTAEIRDATEAVTPLRRQRAECFRAAHDAGHTWGEIARACGVSTSLVSYEVARLAGKDWIWTPPL